MTGINTREEKGKQIASRHDLHRISDNFYHVKSQTTKREYNVVKTNNSWQCDCPDHIFRHVKCKHALAVEFSIKFREEVREKNKVTISPLTISNCLFCKSDKIKKFGIRHNKSGDIQRLLKLQGVTVTHKTIYMWILKYTRIMQKYLNKITPQVGDTWRADEVFVKIRGEMKYVFSLMDDETRFWIAQEVADSKDKHDASSLFKKGKLVDRKSVV